MVEEEVRDKDKQGVIVQARIGGSGRGSSVEQKTEKQQQSCNSVTNPSQPPLRQHHLRNPHHAHDVVPT